MSAAEAASLIKNKGGIYINEPFRGLGLTKQVQAIVSDIVFYDMRELFDIEELNDDMIQQFLEAYKIKAKKLPADDFLKLFNVDRLDNIDIPVGLLMNMLENDCPVDIYEGEGYYRVFIQKGKYTPPSFKGMIYLMHKGALPFVRTPLPVHNKPNFD